MNQSHDTKNRPLLAASLTETVETSSAKFGDRTTTSLANFAGSYTSVHDQSKGNDEAGPRQDLNAHGAFAGDVATRSMYDWGCCSLQKLRNYECEKI
jgi:hypothetical protein